MVDERTRSVVEAGEFLAVLVQNRALPDSIRNEAKRLLRHYPNAREIWMAGRLEISRQNEIFQLTTAPLPLPAVLATWPLCEPFFCDSPDQRMTIRCAVLASAGTPAASWGPRVTGGGYMPRPLQIIEVTETRTSGCLSLKYLCFVSLRALVLKRASNVFGSHSRAGIWFVSRNRSLDARTPCSLVLSANGYARVQEVLAQFENGYW
ncbi:BPSL0761 family protein [Pseudomonas syringae]|nr:BPSL0761 family protein [Pseudomonas syringae]